MGMMDVPEMRRLARVQRFDFWIAVAAIVGDAGVRRARRGDDRDRALADLADLGGDAPARCRCWAGSRAPQVFRELDEHPEDEQVPGVVVLRLDGGLFFATSDALEDRVREVASSTPGR